MTYATAADYVKMLAPDEARATSNLDEPDEMLADRAAIEEHLAIASRQIDARLAFRYSLPLPSAGYPDLRRICIRIARWNQEVYGIREHVRIQYEDALVELDLLAKGKQALIDDAGVVTPPYTSPDALPDSNSQTFVGQRYIPREKDMEIDFRNQGFGRIGRGSTRWL